MWRGALHCIVLYCIAILSMQERLSLPKYSGKTTTLLIQCNSLTNVYIHLKIPLIALGYSLGVSVDLYIIRGGGKGLMTGISFQQLKLYKWKLPLNRGRPLFLSIDWNFVLKKCAMLYTTRNYLKF